MHSSNENVLATKSQNEWGWKILHQMNWINFSIYWPPFHVSAPTSLLFDVEWHFFSQRKYGTIFSRLMFFHEIDLQIDLKTKNNQITCLLCVCYIRYLKSEILAKIHWKRHKFTIHTEITLHSNLFIYKVFFFSFLPIHKVSLAEMSFRCLNFG